MKLLMKTIAASLATTLMAVAHAGVTADEAKQLGTTLTAWGAEQAGNKDGTIPAYTGGNNGSTLPPSYKPGSGRFPDPYADEKPLFRIDAKNMDKYADKLNEGTKEMLKRWSNYYLDVYPTHRSVTYPKFAAENSIKNATRAHIVGNGMGVEGAYGGIPFPIPKSGLEVIWNHYLRYNPLALDSVEPSFLIDADGRKSQLPVIELYSEAPYYDPSQNSLKGLTYFKWLSTTLEPPRASGERALFWFSTNFLKQDFLYWLYTPGQRRVRLTPEAKYDTPIASYGGVEFFDENGNYSGPPDRYDWKLVGKKEMYIPYNVYRAVFGPEDKVLTPKFINPDTMRWELHRVWAVEGNLKEGKRHAYKKRIFYVDEDTWYIVFAEGYDHAGKLYRVAQGMPMQLYDPAHPFMFTEGNAVMDLTKGSYAFLVQLGDPRAYLKVSRLRPAYETTPEALAGSGIR